MIDHLEELILLESTSTGNCLKFKGQWLIRDFNFLDKQFQQLLSNVKNLTMIDASQIVSMDMAGAFLFTSFQKQTQILFPQIKIISLPSQFHTLLKLVSEKINIIPNESISKPKHNWFYQVGKWSVGDYKKCIEYLTFLGELISHITASLLHPIKIQWRSIVNEIDLTGYRALSIVAVMMFLIGIVVAYQMSIELRIYGANAYVVDACGISILREFSPLITSVIIAGRTSTSYAALIGTMKVNEEVDALKTMGLSPMDRLVLPKIFGLLIALPLLVMWGNIFGTIGSMVMAKNILGMGYLPFLIRFKEVIAIKHLYLGLVKTPVFALIIAGIGCFQGFQAEGSAQSVGEHTTKAAVQSIFLIIFADGMFSIVFNWMNL